MTILDEFHRDDRRVLDRLVDGELGVDERRELLAVFDNEPGAWRRCALAFLESQAWRWQLARLASEPIVAQVGAPGKPVPQRRAVEPVPGDCGQPGGGVWLGRLDVA